MPPPGIDPNQLVRNELTGELVYARDVDWGANDLSSPQDSQPIPSPVPDPGGTYSPDNYYNPAPEGDVSLGYKPSVFDAALTAIPDGLFLQNIRGIGNVLNQPVEALDRVGGAIGEQFPSLADAYSKYVPDLPGPRDMAKWAESGLNEDAQRFQADQITPASLAYNGVSMATQMAPWLLAGPNVALGAISGMQGANKAQELLDQGVSFPAAEGAGLLTAGVNRATGLLPLAAAYNPARNLVTRAALSGAVGAPAAVTQEAVNTGIDAALRPEPVTWDETKQRLAHAAANGMVGSMATTGAIEGLQQVQGDTIQKIRSAPSEASVAAEVQALEQLPKPEGEIVKPDIPAEKQPAPLPETPQKVFSDAIDSLEQYHKDVSQPGVHEVGAPDVGFATRFIGDLKNIAERQPEFAPVYKTARTEIETNNAISYDLSDIMQPYFDLKNKTNVHRALVALNQTARNGKYITPTPEFFASRGLNPEEVNAAMSFRQGMDHSLKLLGENGVYDADAVQAMSLSNYVPRMRRGQFMVDATDTTTGERSFQLFKTKAEAMAAAKTMDPTKVSAQVGQAMLDKEFAVHLRKAKNIKGFDTDLEKGAAEYIDQVAKKISEVRSENDWNSAMELLKQGRQPRLLKMAEQAKSDVRGGGNGIIDKITSGVTLMMLGGRLSSPFANVTSLTSLGTAKAQELIGRGAWGFKKAEAEYASAAKQAVAGIKNDPELAAAFKQAERTGIVGDMTKSDISGKAISGKFSKQAMVFFNKADIFAKKTSFIAGYKIAREQGANPEQAYEIAKKHTLEVNADTSAANRPMIARGIGKLGSQFRLPMLNLLKEQVKMLSKGEVAAFAHLSAALFALGGAQAVVPFGSDITRFFNNVLGIDLQQKVREMTDSPTTARVAFRGLLNEATSYRDENGQLRGGISFAGTIGSQSGLTDVAQTLAENPVAAAGNVVLGPTGAILGKIGTAISSYNSGTDKARAMETVLAEGIRQPVIGARIAREGLTTAKGEKLSDNSQDVSTFSSVLKGLGFTTGELERAYRESQGHRNIDKKYAGIKEGVSEEMARGIMERSKGDSSRLNAVIQRIRDNWEQYPEGDSRRIEIDSGEVANQFFQLVSAMGRYGSPTNTKFAEHLKLQNDFRE